MGWAGSFRLWTRHHEISLTEDQRFRSVIPNGVVAIDIIRFSSKMLIDAAA
jgi:hypothetical protein